MLLIEIYWILELVCYEINCIIILLYICLLYCNIGRPGVT